jgi:predicted transcriptional regulator of viral defense system
MNQAQKLKKLENLSYFDKCTLQQFMELGDNSLYANIKRWIKQGLILKLKNGLYVTNGYYVSRENKESYVEFIANKLREPSYLSLEYVLHTYGILAEAVYALTSVTLKSKCSYKNKLGRFSYRNLKPELFFGFDLCEKDGFQINLATKAKALFDYLYYKFKPVSVITRQAVAALRLNLEEFSKKDLAEFDRYVKKAGARKYLCLTKLVEGLRDY